MVKKVLVCDFCGREIKTEHKDFAEDYARITQYCETSEGYVKYHKDVCRDCYLDKLGLPKGKF